jgi:hypothetical protein
MANLSAHDEKNSLPGHDVTSSTDHSMADSTTLELPNSWKYKRFTVLGYRLPWFASPPVQLVIVSFVCFMCPGMFNALNGMGGGGQLDPTANNRANTALYSTFAVVGFFAGTFTNKLGIRTALSFGGIGYSVYVASYLSYNWCAAGCVRWPAVVRSGSHHDVLPARSVQGSLHFLVLDDIQLGRRDW